MWIKNPTDATVCRYLFTVKLLYMFRVSQHPSSGVSKTVPTASGTGHTLKCKDKLLVPLTPPTWRPRRRGVAVQVVHPCILQYDLYRRLWVQYLIHLMMGAVTPETCRVVLQWINICILLHLLDFLFTLNYDARSHELKKLIHPSSGACDFSTVSPHWSVFLFRCVLETRTHDQYGDTIEKSQAPDDGYINARNMLSIEEVK